MGQNELTIELPGGPLLISGLVLTVNAIDAVAQSRPFELSVLHVFSSIGQMSR